jgi:hypothetical protein
MGTARETYGESKNTCRSSVAYIEKKHLKDLGVDGKNITICFKEIVLEGVVCILLPWDRNQRRALIKLRHTRTAAALSNCRTSSANCHIKDHRKHSGYD